MLVRVSGLLFFVIYVLVGLTVWAEPLVSQPNTLGLYPDEEAAQVCGENQP